MGFWDRIEKWLMERYWKKHHLEYIRAVISDDLRWLCVHPVGAILLERYQKLVSPDWHKHNYENIDTLRRRIGWCPYQGDPMALLPTFSTAGWVNNPLEKVDYMLAYFFETQKSQSHFHKGVVTSYQSILADNMSPGQIASDLENKLGDYFKTQFDNVQLGVTVAGANGDPNNSQLTVTIGCSFDSNGTRYTIAHAVELLGTQVKRIYRLDETGSLT